MNPNPKPGMILGGGVRTPSTPVPASIAEPAGPRPLGLDVFNTLGIDPVTGVDEEQEKYPFGRFIATVNAGVGAGFLEPFSFVRPIGRYVQQLKQEAEEAGGGTTAASIGYGAGFLTGFIVPAGMATKVASYGVRGIQAATGMRMYRAADAGLELTRTGMLTQGAIAGAILESGGAVGEGNTRIGEVARGAILGGLGDVAVQSAWRALSASGILGKAGGSIKRAVNEVTDEGVVSSEAAEALARSAQLTDDLLRRTNNVGDDIVDSVEARKTNLMLGMDELGIGELSAGELRVIPNLGGDLSDIRTALDAIPDVKYTFATRTTAAGNTVHDIVMGVGTEIDDEIVEAFGKYGFVPGQEAVWRGRRYILDSPSKNANYVMGIAADSTTRKTPIPRSELQLGSIINPEYSTAKIPNPNGLWLDFARQHGPFPFTAVGDGVPEQGFEAAFEAFSGAQSLGTGAKQQLRLYFLRRQRELLRSVDDGELDEVLKNVSNAATAGRVHPEGNLEELAAQHGLLLKRVPVPTRDGRRQKWGKVLVDAENGQAHGPFTTGKATEEFLNNYPRPMQRLDPDGPLGEGTIAGSAKGTNVTHLLNQAELSNADIPWSVIRFGTVTPYLHFIRRVNDALVKELGDKAPDLYGRYSALLQNMAKQRTSATPWLDKLTKIRGGGLFKSSKVRVEKLESVSDLLESARPGTAEWLKRADELELNINERSVAEQLRGYYDDIFKVAVESGKIDISAEDFIENYMPHIMRRGHNNWVQSYIRAHGRRPSVKVREFVHEFERTGQLTRYEKDPFVVAFRYTDSLFFKQHVSDGWNELLKMVKEIPEQRADNLQENFGLLQVKQTMLDSLAMLRGSPTTADYTTRAIMQNLSKQLGIHLDEKTIDRTISTLISANYGSFMGWRPALAIRNLSQILMTSLPILGPRYVSTGLRYAVRKGSGEELKQMGVVAQGAQGLPFQDLMYYDTVRRGVTEASRGAALSKTAAKVGKAVRHTTQKSLGMQSASDELNRAVTYYGAKQKMIDALTDWTQKGWTRERFNAKSGLSSMGPTVTRDFHVMMPRENPVEVAKWYAAQVTNDAQFVYQQGAGPAMFNTRAGKLFGMYGTWPSWYASLMKQRLTHGTMVDKARFVGYTAAVHMAFMNATYLTGINLSKWTALQFGWAGGPAFDVVKDLSNVIEGEQPDGDPTPDRALSLGKYGLRDTGDMLFEVKDPRRLIEGTAGLFVPGMYMLRDIEEATEQPDLASGLMTAAGFQLEE